MVCIFQPLWNGFSVVVIVYSSWKKVHLVQRYVGDKQRYLWQHWKSRNWQAEGISTQQRDHISKYNDYMPLNTSRERNFQECVNVQFRE